MSIKRKMEQEAWQVVYEQIYKRRGALCVPGLCQGQGHRAQDLAEGF